MPTLLKLANIETFLAPYTRSGQGKECLPVRRGQVCLFEDAEATAVMELKRLDRENQPQPYFQTLDGYEGKIDHDFTEARRTTGNSVRHTDMLGVDTSIRGQGVAQPDTAEVAAPAKTTQRAPRRAPAPAK